jgi:protein-S-isoprenylcysteine O-methyltransferase
MAESNIQGHSNGRMFQVQTTHGREGEYLIPQIRISPDFMPNGRKSLCSISIHAFGLGISLGMCLMLTAQLAYLQHYLWRIPFFISTLSIFHYLEFDMTARYNPPDAKVSSFLLLTNGRAYNIAHSTAILETVIRYWISSSTRLNWSLIPEAMQSILKELPFSPSVVLGFGLILLGQGFRSVAMKQAGTSFNHIVQSNKKEDHVLITSGVYAISRHPAYFGFFWWGLGTQLVLGNFFCFIAYSTILWRFFAHRIRNEEKHLINFFDDAYLNYRRTTPVLIPLI